MATFKVTGLYYSGKLTESGFLNFSSTRSNREIWGLRRTRTYKRLSLTAIAMPTNTYKPRSSKKAGCCFSEKEQINTAQQVAGEHSGAFSSL